MKPRKRNPTLPRSFVPPKKEKKVLEPVVINRSYLQEGFALLFLALGIFCATALFSSFQSLSFLKDVGFQQNLNTLLANNYMGDVGRRISIFLISSLGFCSIAVVICPFIVSFRIWFNNSQPLPDTLKGIMSIFVNGAMMVIALATLMAVFMNHKGGGNLGVTIARKLDVNVGAGGTFLISFFVALSFFSLCTGLKVSKMVTFFVKLWRTFKAVLVDKLKEIRAENAFLQDKDLNPINLIFETVKFTFHIIAVTLFTVFFTVPHILFVKARREIVRFLSDKFSYDFTNKKNHALDNFKVVKTKKGTLHLQFDVNKKLKNEIRKNKKKGEKLEEEDTDTEFKLGDNPRRSKLRISRVKGDNKKKEGNKLLTKLKKKITPKEEKKKKDTSTITKVVSHATYSLPPINLLSSSENEIDVTPTEEEIHKNSVQLEQTLNDFGIRGKIVEVQAGPIVTLYQYKPAPGIRVQKIISLDNDMARTLKVPSIRTYAPVPGHDTVGIELPNAMREIVYFRDVIDSEAWHKADDYDLKIALAKNTFGEPYVVDLARMPHLLVAGATGTGKSVSLNSIVLSLLYQHTPETLKLMMFDPKQVELSIYESIPHLITPVITDAKDAKGALLWLMEEMERRLSLMKELGVRNIKSFNKAVAGEKIELDALETDLELDDEVIELGDKLKVDPNTQIKNSTRKQYEPLPLIVVVIDEYADLIMSVREIEEYIIRLAAKSRATGIHLIIATQRPSADIVTGLIKANFPSRIAFKVVSWRDAQTIMDAKGAEKLLGRGDMLFLPPGSAMPKRMHGPFVDEKEVHAVVAWLKDRNVPVYNENIAKMIAQVHLLDINVKANTLNNSAKDEEDGENKRDKIYEDKILPFIVSRGEASISMIQTEFEFGYPRASKYIRWLEKDGIIGPADGAKRRKVLVEPSEIQFRKKDKVNHSSRSVNIEKIDFDAEMADGDSEESLL